MGGRLGAASSDGAHLTESRCNLMRVDFNQIEPITIPGMNRGTGTMTAKMYADKQGKIIPCVIHPGGSIGLHQHASSDDINYVISGSGMATTDGAEEPLSAGICHICRKGSSHSIVNTGQEDLVLRTIVVERETKEKHL